MLIRSGPASPVVTRRSFFAGSAVAIAAGAGLLAGCGGGTSGNSKTGTIKLLADETNPATVNAFKAAFDDFEKQHPGVTVKGEYLGFDEAVRRLTQLVGAGSPPDLVKQDNWGVARLAAQGMLEPVTDVVAELGDVPRASRLVFDGQDYLIPLELNLWMIFYRKDLFESAGLGPPATWNDFRNVLERFPSGPNYANLLVSNAAGGYTGNDFYDYAMTNDVEFWTWDGNHWTVALDQEPNRSRVIETLELFQERSRHSPPSGNYEYSQANQAYASGSVALIDYPGARTLEFLREQKPDLEPRTGVSTLPYGRELKVSHGTAGLAIPRGGDIDRQLIKELALSMARGKHYLDYLWSVPGHLVPATREVLEGDWRNHEQLRSRPDLLKVIDESWAHSYNILDPSDKAARPNLAAGVTVQTNVYSELVAQTVSNKQSPDEAVEAAVKKMRDALSRYGK